MNIASFVYTQTQQSTLLNLRRKKRMTQFNKHAVSNRKWIFITRESNPHKKYAHNNLLEAILGLLVVGGAYK